MSVKACRECGHLGPGEEGVCPSCGAALSRRPGMLRVAFVVLALVVTAIVYVGMPRPGSVPQKDGQPGGTPDALQGKVDQLLLAGTVTKVEGHSIWVEPGLWRLRADDNRKAIAATCGNLAGIRDGSKKAWCEVRDNRTGKIIAEWSEATGLRPAAP